MAGYHSAIAIHPGTGYGIVVLLGGRYPDAAKLAYDTFNILQPTIDNALAQEAISLYAGRWTAVDGDDGKTFATVVVEKGTLYVEQMNLFGVDVLERFGAPGRLALRNSMRKDEFRYVNRDYACITRLRRCRLDTGIPGYNGVEHMGCYPYWNGQDIWGIRNNAAINALYFSGEGKGRMLHIPALSLVLERK